MAELQYTKKGTPKNYQSVIFTSGLRKRQRNTLITLPTLFGGVYGTIFHGTVGGLGGAALGAGIGTGAAAYVNHNRKKVLKRELSLKNAHEKNKKAMLGAIYGGLGSGIVGGHYVNKAYLHHQLGNYSVSSLETDPELPKGVKKFKGGLTKSFHHFHDEGAPWVESKEHTTTWGLSRRGPILNRTKFPVELTHSNINVKEPISLEDAIGSLFSGTAPVEGEWSSAVHTEDKTHTHYSGNTVKIGAVAAGTAALGIGGYETYKHRADIARAAHNLNKNFHASHGYHTTRDFYYRHRFGKQERVKKGKR